MSSAKVIKILTKVTSIFSGVMLILTTVFGTLTGGIDALSNHKRHPEVFKENVLFLGAFTRSQGITTDNEHFFFSSKAGLLKTELDGTTRVAIELDAIPKQFKDEYSSAHIGGISYYNGKIYAGIEDSKIWKYPIIAVFDSETLKFTGEWYMLDNELITRGVPYVTVDAERQLLYVANHSVNQTELVAYDLETMELFERIILSETVERIQGGEMFNGKFYGASNDTTQAIYEIDPETGAVRKYIERNLTSGSEGEGMTVLYTDEGAFFYAIDMGPLFINAFIRCYEPITD